MEVDFSFRKYNVSYPLFLNTFLYIFIGKGSRKGWRMLTGEINYMLWASSEVGRSWSEIIYT